MVEESLKLAKILIVDDQEYNLSLLERILDRAGYKNLNSSTNPRQTMPLIEQLDPDIVLLDLHMPEMDGFEVLRLIREHTNKDSYLPVLVLTADITPEAKKSHCKQALTIF